MVRFLPALPGNGLQRRQRTAGEAATVRATGGYATSYTTMGGIDPARAVQRYYEQVLWVWRCVDAIATKASERDIVFRRDKRDLKAEEAQDRDLDRLLNKRANMYETSAHFRYRLSTQLLLSRKGVFVEVVKSNSGGYSQFHLLNPANVNPIPHPETFISGYEVSNGVNAIDTLLPEQVLWIKLKPHPTDPYRQMTPLESAGIIADTDILARHFNKNFLQNDGRPGMLITVRDLNPDDAERLQERFSGGPSTAGVTTVLEGDGLDVADLSTSPRDAQWLESLASTKQDIMLAFGVPESVMGNSSERTFNNADAEDVGFWTHTMLSHMGPISAAFDSLTAGGNDDDIFVVHDTTDVWALQATKRADQEAARSEFQAGLMTLNDYLRSKGMQPIDAPEADVYWQVPGTIPIGPEAVLAKIKAKQPAEVAPGSGADGAVIDPAALAGGIPADGAVPTPEVAQIGAQLAGLNRIITQDRQQQARARDQVDGKLRELLSARELPPAPARTDSRPRSNRPSGGIKTPKGRKSLDAADDDPSRTTGHRCKDVHTEHPYAELRNELESTLYGIAEQWSDDQIGVVDNRLRGRRARKGTRHWEGAPVTKALPAGYVVNPARWEQALRDMLTPPLMKAVEGEVRDQMKALGMDEAQGMGNTVVSDLSQFIARNALAQSSLMEDIIRDADKRGMGLEDIRKRVANLNKVRAKWLRSFTTQLTTAAIEGARAYVREQFGNYRKTWHGVMDSKTRVLHRRLHGRTIYAKNAFVVSGVRIRYPGDPEAPIEMTANCRCWLTYTPGKLV